VTEILHKPGWTTALGDASRILLRSFANPLWVRGSGAFGVRGCCSPADAGGESVLLFRNEVDPLRA